MFHALIVGIDTYADEKINNLAFARADAEAVASLLNERVDGARQVTLLVDERATKARIARVLTDELPQRVRPEDDVLVFFAGHGSPEVDGTCGDPSIHAVTHDTHYARLGSTGINMVTELSAWVRRLPARRVTVVLDASFNGAAGGRTFEGPGLWSGPRTRRLDRVSLNRLAFGANGALLAASSDKEAAKEDATLRHGLLTFHLRDLLTRAPAGTLSLAAVHGAVARSVCERTNGAQNPTLHARQPQQAFLHLRPQPVLAQAV